MTRESRKKKNATACRKAYKPFHDLANLPISTFLSFIFPPAGALIYLCQKKKFPKIARDNAMASLWGSLIILLICYLLLSTNFN